MAWVFAELLEALGYVHAVTGSDGRALGLVHPTANLDVIASSVRLRISRAKIVVAPDVATAEHLVMLA